MTTTETKTINNVGPEQESVLGITIQRGYVYRVIAADDSAWDCSEEFECEDGSTHTESKRFGYHGNDVPLCGADYLYGDETGELLVISSESEPEEIDTVEGFSLEKVTLERGSDYHDGTWSFSVIRVGTDGETTIAGHC